MRTSRNQRLDQPRAIPEPSQRNLMIYDEVIVHQRVQHEVARQFGLSQRRISQICQQVDQWRERTAVGPDGEPSQTQKQGMERLLVRRRYEHLYALALEGLLHERRGLVTKKTITTGGQTTCQVTERAVPCNPHLLEIAQSVSGKLHKMDEEQGQWDEAMNASLLSELDEGLVRLMREIRPDLEQLAQGESQTISANDSPQESPDSPPPPAPSRSTCAQPNKAPSSAAALMS